MLPFLLRYSEQSGRGEMLPCPFLRPYESQRSINCAQLSKVIKYLDKKKMQYVMVLNASFS